MFNKIASILAEILGCDTDEIFMETKLTSEYGIEPIDIAKLVIECEREYKIEILDEDVHTFGEVGDIIKYIKERRSL